jgi:hypothetical protein
MPFFGATAPRRADPHRLHLRHLHLRVVGRKSHVRGDLSDGVLGRGMRRRDAIRLAEDLSLFVRNDGDKARTPEVDSRVVI